MGWFRDFLDSFSVRSTAPADGVTTSRQSTEPQSDETMEQFAERACKSVASRDIALGEVGELIDLLIDATMATHTGADKGKAFHTVMAGLAVFCPKCGQFNENAVAMLAMANDPLMGKAVFGGPNVASLAQSRCPHCGGTTAKVVFDPTKAVTS